RALRPACEGRDRARAARARGLFRHAGGGGARRGRGLAARAARGRVARRRRCPHPPRRLALPARARRGRRRGAPLTDRRAARARLGERVGLARRSPRDPVGDGRDAGPARAADGEPGAHRRRELHQGLLHGSGDRRARAAPRHGEAPRLRRERGGRRGRGRRALRRGPGRPGRRPGGERGRLARGRYRRARVGQRGEPRVLHRAPALARRSGAALFLRSPRVKLSYYIYYKVPRENAAAARAAVEKLQRDVAAATGVRGRLLRRRDDETTWMEIYEDVEDGAKLEAALDELARRHGVAALLSPGGGRRREVFREL